MKIMEIMIGIPGSGKSTLAKEISEKTGAIIFSSDDIRDELVKKKIIENLFNTSTFKIVFEELHKRLLVALDKGHDVIIDSATLEKKFRKIFINFGKQYGYFIRGRFMEISKEEAVKRIIKRQTGNPKMHQIEDPKNVVDRYYNQLLEEYPSLDEGFDEIIKYKQK